MGAILALALIAGCRASSEDAAEHPPSSEPGGPAVSVAFEPDDTLQIMLGETAPLVVRLTPPGPGRVRFSLLDEHGDAALDASSVDAGDDGLATTMLHAPREASTFRVRASLEGGGPTAERAVSVSGEGFATLLVSPAYGGKRSLKGWVATADASGAKCADLKAAVPPDGPLQVEGAAGPLSLEAVPAGLPLVVTVRSAGLAGGCLDVEPLTAGETRKIKVTATNAPLQIAPLSLDVTLSLDPSGSPTDKTSWPQLVGLWSKRFLEAFYGGASEPEAALLDTVAVSLPAADRAAFQARRHAEGWDDLVAKTWGASGGIGVMAQWVKGARASLEASPGSLHARLSASSSMAMGKAQLAPSELLTLATTRGDVLGSKTVTWEAAPDDRVQTGGELPFWPSRVMARGVEAVVLAGPTPASSIPDALALGARCADVSKAIAAGQIEVFPGCNKACATKLCTGALETMWQRALGDDAQKGTGSVLVFAASGEASLDDNARVVGFSGAWVGSVNDPSAGEASQVPMKGEAKGAPPKKAP